MPSAVKVGISPSANLSPWYGAIVVVVAAAVVVAAVVAAAAVVVAAVVLVVAVVALTACGVVATPVTVAFDPSPEPPQAPSATKKRSVSARRIP